MHMYSRTMSVVNQPLVGIGLGALGALTGIMLHRSLRFRCYHAYCDWMGFLA